MSQVTEPARFTTVSSDEYVAVQGNTVTVFEVRNTAMAYACESWDGRNVTELCATAGRIERFLLNGDEG